MPPDRNRLLTVVDVLNVTGFKSRTTLYRRARNGSFPSPCLSIGAEPGTGIGVQWGTMEIGRNHAVG